ncbi:D-alanine--D-alanine ligase family protein [Brachyspira hyodysenteriae]|uniref:D-alanine--D-alanine ligase family protein n=1 Tax=Brachyspira hyodysenteriae TaxID=159 RepID=UPI0011830AAA|nr:D-alanine--D-alanine ligase [Brachyspira hyodysenteriae]TVL55491.1 D-alanine--D-alanine ligase [Brachyspira hyodysenteriae]TVL58620.1 D-alanine--D-alanine ligase [Brachyspira hyodysenteriae]TVL82786.1 D-alanine--D-alanine ligase [Brachyspira hyodysenteriae]
MILNSELKQNILNRFKNKKIAVLHGGLSSEREVSLRSGQNVYKALTSFNEIKDNCILIDVKDSYELVKKLKENNIEYCYNILHGTSGEDGTVQGLLESLNIKYTGENILVSAVCMNKVYTKRIWKSSNVSTADFMLLKDVKEINDSGIKGSALTFNFPLILKPISDGSSVGVHLIKTKTEFESVVSSIKDSENYFLEPYIKGKEITVGLVKQDDENIYVFPILGINSKNEIYDYEAKYTPGKTEMEMPAKLSKEIENKVIETCKKAYKVLGCSGLSRIDAIVGNDNEVYLMEVNTQGGMTNTSDIPAMAKHINLDFNDLVLYILGLLK